MSRCENCGCGMSSGLCSNCDEEAYIMENQSEWAPEEGYSEGFADKAREQFKNRKKGVRECN